MEIVPIILKRIYKFFVLTVIHKQKILEVKRIELITIKIEINDTVSQHSGGDKLLFLDFINLLEGNKSSVGLTSLEKSVESHIAAFRAEESRVCGGKTIDLMK